MKIRITPKKKKNNKEWILQKNPIKNIINLRKKRIVKNCSRLIIQGDINSKNH